MIPSVSMVHAWGKTLTCCWLRVVPNGRTAVVVGGLPGGVWASGATWGLIAFPAGAQARPLRPGRGEAALGKLPCWVQAQVCLDAGNREAAATVEEGLQLDDLFALMPETQMGMLTIARPREPAAVHARTTHLSDRVAELESQRGGRGTERLALARAEGELSYLEESAPQGLWELEFWAGAQTEADARAVIGLVGASVDVAAVPLRLRPPRATSESGLAWADTVLTGVDCVAAIARPPVRELSGLRVAEVPDFDITPEVEGQLPLGRVLDATRQESLPFEVPLASVNRHVFVTGATGSGKSHTVRTLLEQLTAKGVPWMVIEPAKAEYARMAGRLGATDEVVVIRPGAPGQFPASLNPLEPSAIVVEGQRHAFPLQTHLDLVRALFVASFQAEEPFPQILASALTVSYQSEGWSLALDRAIDGDPMVQPRYPTLSDVQRHALEVIDSVGYGHEVRDNVRGFVKVRIDSLRLGTPGRFFEGGHPLDIQGLLGRNVVFEIEDVGDDRDKAFFIGNILIRVFEVLRLKEAHGLIPQGLSHVLVVEEAHRLLQNALEGTPAAQAVTMFANLLAEVRAYGEGIVVAEQIPAKIISDVVKNSAVKLVHRLPSADDREFVGATMNLTEAQSRIVVSLEPGVAAAHVDGMDHPILVRVDGTGGTKEARAPQPAAPPIRVRSRTCPAKCEGSPCSLEHLVLAEHLAATPEIVLWAEVVTLAHLLHEPPGSIGERIRTTLDAAHPDRAQCALGVAADGAVDRRTSLLRRHYDPDGLRRSVVGVMSEQWQNHHDAPIPDVQWNAGVFRWVDIIAALEESGDGVDRSSPHPLTKKWALRGLILPEASWTEQRQFALDVSLREGKDPKALLLGQPPALLEAIDALASSADAETRLWDSLIACGLPKVWPWFRLRTVLNQ